MLQHTTDAGLAARKAIAIRSVDIMEHGTVEDFDAVVHPAFFNHEQRDEPPGTRALGPRAVRGVAEWLRSAYGGIHWDHHHAIASGDLVVLHVTMAGRHTGDFVAYDLEGRVDAAFAPTGRTFAGTQSHWLRVLDGQVVEHWANRDDLGTAVQLGWAPPTPAYLVRCALAKRRAVRVAAPPVPATVRPFPVFEAGEDDDAVGAALRALDRPGLGGEPFRAMGSSLHGAFDDLGHVVHHVVAEDDLVAVHMTVSGCQVGPFSAVAPLHAVYPPTRRSFAITATHWLRLGADGEVAEHWCERDELGMAMQLGWIPPSPLYALRMLVAR